MEEKIVRIRGKLVKVCPKIDECGVPLDFNEFKIDCIGSWENCFLNSSKLPAEWLKDMQMAERE